MNSYHLFAASIIGMIACIIACTQPEPQPTGVKLHCVQDQVHPGQTCYFQATFGDTVIDNRIIDADTTLIVGATGSAPRDIDCTIKGKYCQLYCFYMDCSYHFLPCCFYINVDGVNVYESCTNGISRAAWIN